VADARPDYEYEESVAKSRAVLAAIELALAQPDWDMTDAHPGDRQLRQFHLQLVQYLGELTTPAHDIEWSVTITPPLIS